MFMRRTSALWNAILALAVLPATGCLLRTRRVEEQYSKAPLKNSTQQGLIDSVNQQAEAIRTLKATVQIASSAGGIKKGKVTDYTDIRGYILARKPDELRMVGLMPYVRTTAFDMVSDGREFKRRFLPRTSSWSAKIGWSPTRIPINRCKTSVRRISMRHC